MRCPDFVLRLLRWLYVSQPARLVSAHARGTHQLSIADRARDRGDWAKAATHYQLSLNEFTHRHDLWIQLGNMRKEIGDLTGSRAAYEAALALAAGDSDLALQLGHLTKIQGHVEEGREWYRKALELDARNQSAFEELAALGEDLHTISELLSHKPSPSAAESADQDSRLANAQSP